MKLNDIGKSCKGTTEKKQSKRDKLIHPVSGVIKPLTRQELLDMIDKHDRDTLARVRDMMERFLGVLVLEVIDMNSSSLGHRMYHAIGGERIPDLQTCSDATTVFGYTPSQYHYPVAYYAKGITD